VPSGEEGVQQIKALAGIQPLVSNVNLPNQGQAPDFPEGSVVETNALFTRDSIRPVCAGRMKRDVFALVMPHVLCYDEVVHTVLASDLSCVRHAFCSNPQLVGISYNDASALFDQIVSNTKQYIPKDLLAENR
jgi:alpha-galactosidase